MAKNDHATIVAYEQMIAAMNNFQKKNLEIAEVLAQCAKHAVAAMDEDTTSMELLDQVSRITNQMMNVDERARILKKDLESTLDALLSLHSQNS